ncbi:MFS transporter [Aeromicrobium sp. zg-636]|uniref:MFS transporter n=1 Tax=Aeromicrobium senzhongii TaxID=2663859 RepID=A0A8I0K2Y2_9ACTN|nr:MFS transporter [Aeromicrobium sp. 636]MBC9226480.1 MFS transporter [Aeromicrobium senzhongii]
MTDDAAFVAEVSGVRSVPSLARFEKRPRNAARLLVDPDFASVFWGKLFGFAGVTIQTLVTSLMAFEATGSAFAVGLVNAALFAPQVLVGPWSGAAADRGWATHQIIAGRLVSAASVGALAVWTATSDLAGWKAIAVMCAACWVAGTGLAIGGAAMNSLVPQLVARSELPVAMSLNTVPVSVARVAGPALGAYVFASSGAVVALWWAAAGHAVFAIFVLAVRPPGGPRLPRSSAGQVRAAWAYVLHDDRLLLRLLLAVTFIGFGSEPVFILAPTYADGFGGGAALVGSMSASFGVGAALGLVLSFVGESRLPHARTACVGFWLLTAAAAGCAVVQSSALAHVAFAVAGAGFTLAMAGVNTLLQLRIPNELRGRVMAMWMIGLVGARPITALFVGSLADLWSDRIAFGATAVLMAGATWAFRPARIAGT